MSCQDPSTGVFNVKDLMLGEKAKKSTNRRAENLLLAASTREDWHKDTQAEFNNRHYIAILLVSKGKRWVLAVCTSNCTFSNNSLKTRLGANRTELRIGLLRFLVCFLF